MSAQSPCCTMCDARHAVKVFVDMWRYWITTFLRHLPTSLIVLVSTLSRSNAMAPPTRIKRALTLVGLKPTFGPTILTASWSDLVIYVLLIVEHFPFWDTASIGVWSLETCICRCATRLLIYATAHAWGCPVFLCKIEFPLTPFFCVAKTRLTKLTITQV